MRQEEREIFKDKLQATQAIFNITKEEAKSLIKERKNGSSIKRELVAYLSDPSERAATCQRFCGKNVTVRPVGSADGVQQIINTEGNGFPLLTDLKGFYEVNQFHKFRRALVVIDDQYAQRDLDFLDSQEVPWVMAPFDVKVASDVLRL